MLCDAEGKKESRMKQRDDRLFILQGLLCPEWGHFPVHLSRDPRRRTGYRRKGFREQVCARWAKKVRHQIHCRWISLHGSVEVGVRHVVSADTQAQIHLRRANQRVCEAGQITSVPDTAPNHKRINVDHWIHVV